MRKYLLASAAALGLVAGGAALNVAQAAEPAPGTLNVYVHGFMNDQFDMVGGSSYANYNGTKLAPETMSGFVRLYFGFDGKTESGIDYGTHLELRTAYGAAGKGIHEGSTNLTGFAIRRAYMTVSTPSMGMLRVGDADGIWWLLATGEYYSFGDGNLWNSDGGVATAVPSPLAPSGLFTATGALYTTNKIIYVSPNIAGFKFGFDYEPNSNGFKMGALCSVGDAGCAQASSVPGADGGRRRNTVTAGLEYSGMFSGVGVKAAVDYMHGAPLGGSPVANGTYALDSATGKIVFSPDSPATFTAPVQYKTIEVGEISAEVKYAGLTVGANVKDGQVAHGYGALEPGQRKDFFVEVNAIYDFGPYTVGGYYFNDQSAGAHNAATTGEVGQTQTNWGIALGANYSVSKNFGVYVTYLYGQRKQAGYDFLTNTVNSTENNQVDSQAFSVGAHMKW